MEKLKKTAVNLIPLFSILFMLTVWEVASLFSNSEYILPSIGETIKKVVLLLKTSDFYTALLSTLFRSFIAFIISFVIAFVLGYLAFKYKNAKRFISPIIGVIRALPTIAVILLLLFYTNSNVAPVIVTMLVVLPTTYTSIYNAFSLIDKDVLEMCKVYKVSKKETLFKVIIPYVLPEIIRIIGAGLTLNLKLMVAGEVLASTINSIGSMLNSAKVYYEISLMLALVLITVILGVVIELFFNAVSKRVGERL